MKRIRTVMSKSVYLGLSILEISKIVMYDFWYDYVKLKYREKAKLCSMDTDSFIETEDIYVYNKKETRFDTGIYELERPLLRAKKEKKVIR